MREHPADIARMQRETSQLEPGSLEEERALRMIDEARAVERARTDETFAARQRRWERQQRRAVRHYRER